MLPPCPAPDGNSLLLSCIVLCFFTLTKPGALISLQIGENLWQPLCLPVFCILHFLTEACTRSKTLYYPCTHTATFSSSKICRCYSCLRPQKGPSSSVTGHGVDSCTMYPSNPLIFTKRRNKRTAAYAYSHQVLLACLPKSITTQKNKFKTC